MSPLRARLLDIVTAAPKTTPEIVRAIDGTADPMRQSRAYSTVYAALCDLAAAGLIRRHSLGRWSGGAPVSWSRA